MLPPLRRMLDAKDDDLVCGIVHRAIDEIGITLRHKFTNAFGLLKPADMRKKDEVLQALIDRSPNTPRCCRVTSLDVIGNGGNIFQRS